MSELDIRKVESEITSIRVSSDKSQDITSIGAVLKKWSQDNFVEIRDDGNEYVLVNGVTHGRNLIKGIEKAISLGWLK